MHIRLLLAATLFRLARFCGLRGWHGLAMRIQRPASTQWAIALKGRAWVDARRAK